MLQRIISLLLGLFIVLGGAVEFAPSALAAGNQTNQAGARFATLTADSPNFEISVYPKPDSKLERLGYGLAGDKVTILEQRGVNQGFSWYRVQFENPAAPEGWIQEPYLTFLNADPISAEPPTPNRYLGNRPQQQPLPGNQRQYNYNNYSSGTR